MRKIKRTLFAFLSLSLLTGCGVGNSDVSSILSSITGNSGTSTGGATTTSSTSAGGASTSSNSTGTSSSTPTGSSLSDGTLTKTQLLALATINASHTFGEITEAFSITSGTASTSETIVTQSKGNEIKAVVTTDSYTNTNYLLFKDNVIKKVSVYDIKNQTAVSTDLTSTASTLNVVTGAATKQGEISNLSFPLPLNSI